MEGESVKVTVSNLPPNVAFAVYIARADGSEPVFVGLIKSTNGSKVTATFELPDAHDERATLEIQLENLHVVMDAVKEFDND